MLWDVPPNDNGKYHFREDLQKWEQLPMDEFGFILTDARIEEIRPFPSWEWSWAILNFIPPTPKPVSDNITFWDEESLSWKEEIIPEIPEKPNDGKDYTWHGESNKWVTNPATLDDPIGVVWDDNIKDYVGASTVAVTVMDPHIIKGESKEQEWPSWTLGEDGLWHSPIPYPLDGQYNYAWDEYTKEWFVMLPYDDEYYTNG